jgi:exonuclease SbcD
MRILHTADWHLGDRLGRIDRTDDLRRAVERVAGYCASEKVDVLLVAGDLFSELSRPDGLRESIRHLRDVFLPFLLGGGTLVAITGNHDNETFCHTLRHTLTLAAPTSSTVGELLPAGRLYLAAEPGLLRLADRAGQQVQFVLLPYPTPSRYLDETAQQYATVEEKNRVLQQAFAGKLRELLHHSTFRPEVPTVLVGHIHVDSARLPGSFRISERHSVLFADQDLPENCAYVALGHIHQGQCLGRRCHVRYSGSIERLDLGEQHDEKSVVLVDIDSGGLRGEPACLPLPATPIYHVEIHDPHKEVPHLRERYPDAERALVRYAVRYKAGRDNLEQVLNELDKIFPRWYQREWQEASVLSEALSAPSPVSGHENFHDTVITYLKTQLADHADHDALLELAETLLAEET